MRVLVRVGAIIFYKNKLITTKMRKGGQIYYVLPGGGVEDTESIFDAIKREIKEETNLEICNFRLVYIRELNIKDKGRGIEFYFYIDSYKGEPKKGFDPELKEASFEELCLIDIDKLKEIIFHPKQLIHILKRDKKENFKEIKHF